MAVISQQPAMLQQILQPSVSFVSADANYTIRDKAISEAAKTLGVQSGLFWASTQMNAKLEKMAPKLNAIYHFQSLMIYNFVVPPVITQEDHLVNVSNDVIRFGAKRYRIIRKARFSSAAPTWRSYVWMTYTRPDVPDSSLLPKNNEEKIIWDKAVLSGWNTGIKQAKMIFARNMHILTRDFSGMLLFHRLVMTHVITLPVLKKEDLGITGNASNMVLGDKQWKIALNSQLQKNAKFWAPLMVKGSLSDEA